MRYGLNPLLKKVFLNVATIGPVGYIPRAPGTFGTLVGLALFLVVAPSPGLHLVLIIAGFLTGIYAAGVAEEMLNQKDSGKIIIDECIGLLVAVFALPITYGYMAAAFLLFRFFDILKPFPIRRIERFFAGGLGVMADDIAAGLFTNILLHIWTRFF